MSTLHAFEVHTMQGDRWRIDSVFDDRALALFEAKRLEQNLRYRSVRVVEEWFDERTNQSRTKAIYERDIRAGDGGPQRQRRMPSALPRVGAIKAAGSAPAIDPQAGWVWTAAAFVLGIGVAIGAWLALG